MPRCVVQQHRNGRSSGIEDCSKSPAHSLEECAPLADQAADHSIGTYRKEDDAASWRRGVNSALNCARVVGYPIAHSSELLHARGVRVPGFFPGRRPDTRHLGGKCNKGTRWPSEKSATGAPIRSTHMRYTLPPVGWRRVDGM